ncbi:MAG: spermidine synthase [Rhodospirillales bacterium]|nr:spermidine synthase [Rhodospirillales bacterium]
MAVPRLRRLRRHLIRQYGRDHALLVACDAPHFGSSVFVVDHRVAGRQFRSLASLGRHGRTYDQSSMDIGRPAYLVFPYESFMAAAFGLASSRRSALLLGLGGGAMCRHLAALLPGCALTIVEIDPVVVGLTRRYFGVAQRVVVADADGFMARNRRKYDVVLIDLYDGRGFADVAAGFWRNCIASLAPGGCLAVNWADFARHRHLERYAAELASFGFPPVFLAPPSLADNLVQLVPTGPGTAESDVRALAKDFCREIGANSEVLNDCLVSRDYPRVAAAGW